ncbi:HAMP domain-containing sensor histidine kinase [soil metagenome]
MESDAAAPLTAKPGFATGLSGKVLALTLAIVILGEVLIFVPTLANFRLNWLKGRIAQAEIAALAVEAAPDRMLSSDLRSELLMGAGVLVVSLKKGDARQLILRSETRHMIDASFDLRNTTWMSEIYDAFAAVMAGPGRIIAAIDTPPNMSGDFIEVALEESPLRSAMLAFTLNILFVSVVLWVILGAIIFYALNRVLVRPMQRLAANMMAFSADPGDRTRIIQPSERRDEIGVAERQLHDMQSELASTLKKTAHLAALGLAVSKVTHDLRNMLTSAQLISDRLSMANDPTVQKFAPKLIASLDRAIEFCVQTLKYGRADEAPPRRERFPVKEFADEVIDAAVLQASSRVVLYNAVASDIAIDADREQLHRVLINLVQNAVQALEQRALDGSWPADGAVTLSAWRTGAVVTLEVKDNGPGIPKRARARLFEAFQSSGRSGGTGLGLTIAAELSRAHGGALHLHATGPEGTIFHVTIPDRIGELHTGRRGERRAAEG